MADLGNSEYYKPAEGFAPHGRKRAAAMARIDAAILEAQQQPIEHKTTAYEDNSLLAPPPSLATPQQKEEAKAQATADKILSERQEQILAAQKKLLGEEEAKRLREEQEREAAKSQFVKGTERTIKNASNVVHGADVRIGNIPQPGSIVFPLVLLLLFFFILIQVNGFSRIGWLWLVISGNGYVWKDDQTANRQQLQQSGQGGEQLPAIETTVIPRISANGVYGSVF